MVITPGRLKCSKSILVDDFGRNAIRLRTRIHLVRFEGADGEGLFSCLFMFRDLIGRWIRCPRKIAREFHDLDYALRQQLQPVPAIAYQGDRSREPITWFRGSATRPVQLADQLVQLMNRFGTDIRRIETDQPEVILWEDEVQVVTRAPRRPRVRTWGVLYKRHGDRRKRLAKLRRRASWQRVRRSKSGI